MMPDVPGIDIQCGGCGAHFQLDPAGDVAGAACSECGGKRFFRDQPSPTQSDGTLRDMVDSDSQKDQGGNPLGEGTIVGDDAVKPFKGGQHDDYTHSKVAADQVPWQMAADSWMDTFIDPRNQQVVNPAVRNKVHELAQSHYNSSPVTRDAIGNWPEAYKQAWINMKGFGGADDIHHAVESQGPTAVDFGSSGDYRHPDPWMDNEPGSLTFPEHWVRGKVAYPIEPPMLYERTDIPEGVTLDTYRHTPHDYTCPECRQQYDRGLGYHHHCVNTHPETQTVSKKVDMRTLDMEPYPSLWEDVPITKQAGAAALGLIGDAAGAIGGLAARAMPTLMKGALGRGIGFGAAEGLMGGGQQGQQSQQAGGMGPDPVEQAPGLQQLGSVDIPFLLLADLETPSSVKSVDEQHDDPEKQDQKEFNDGDNSPSNHKNPNNQDSGADGEDGVRDATPGYGIGENSPALQRAMMVLPLLLHYFQSDESGEQDPIIRGLHDAFEKESPGYMDNGDPDGHKYVELIIQNHSGQKPQIHAGVNAFPGGLPATPQPGMGMDAPGGGSCPNCGGVLAGDGSCPQCGHKVAPQGGMTPGAIDGTMSLPPNAAHVANSQGPVTQEQKEAIKQLVDTRPELFGDILNEIQNQPNTPPLVDPSQAQPTPAPMPGMMNPQGASPVVDPSQMGGGGGMPMQPMAKSAAPYGRDTEWPRELPSPQTPEKWHHLEPGESNVGVGELGLGQCPQCGAHSLTPFNGMCNHCGFAMPQDSPDVALPGYDPQGAYTLSPGEMDEGLLPRHWGNRLADANNNVRRCPKCDSATTMLVDGFADDDGQGTKVRCHSCNHTWDIEKNSKVALVDMVNPLLQNAAEQADVRPDDGQDSSRTWVDDQGNDLMEGGTYELHAPGFDVPDQVKVISKKPDALGVKLVGEFSNINTDDATPDFTITPQQLQLEKYTFKPSGGQSVDQADPKGLGGMPGLDQIPQSGPTTDESANSYPNQGTVSHIVANDMQDDVYEDLCHRCGGNWIDHTASSSSTTMHECARCGCAWETQDNYEGREAGTNLGWLYDDARDETFHAQVARAQGMSEYGQGSRSLASVAAKDERLQAVRDVLEHNKQQRTAGRHFTPGEQRELIHEKGTARNLEDLDLTNTHYETRSRYEFDPMGKANPMNVPDAHLLLGV